MSGIFNFEGGDELTVMGATWFVSYSYYKLCDSSHLNWKSVSTYNNRISVYNTTRHYHRYWLNEVLKMSARKLSTNHIALDGDTVKKMAKDVLRKLPDA